MNNDTCLWSLFRDLDFYCLDPLYKKAIDDWLLMTKRNDWRNVYFLPLQPIKLLFKERILVFVQSQHVKYEVGVDAK